jgi:uncharacterized protein (UPF0332 family)
LADAGSDSISPETRLEQAYNVILTCAIAALAASGYRVISRTSTHYTAIETLRNTLGLDEDKIDYYQSLRVLRHRDIYEPEIHIDDDDMNLAIKEAEAILDKLETWLLQE